jgi:hypothetical protein
MACKLADQMKNYVTFGIGRRTRVTKLYGHVTRHVYGDASEGQALASNQFFSARTSSVSVPLVLVL